MTHTVWMTRHGSRQDFVDPEWHKQAEFVYDPPLSSHGQIQASELAQRLRGEKIAHVFSSPFLRCVQTAHRVAEAIDLELKLEWGLGEWLNPQWFSAQPDTCSADVLKEQYPRISTKESYLSRIRYSYPETDEKMLRRSAETVEFLTREFSGALLLVGHAASVVGVATGLLGQSTRVREHRSLMPRIPFGCLVKLSRQEDGWEMELNGDTSHLTDAAS